MKAGLSISMFLAIAACGPETAVRAQTPALSAPLSPPAEKARKDDPEVHPSFEEGPNPDLAQGWFYQNPDNGSWCAFSDLAAAKRYVDESLPYGTRSQGWLTLKDGRLETITELSFSEDAYAEDRYFFDNLRITAMKRSGRVINARQATYPFAPDGSGGLTLTDAGKRVVDDIRGDIDMYYIVDWPRRGRVEDFPFFPLLDLKDGRIFVRQACTPATGPVEP